MNNFKEKADLIWKVADLLRGDYKQSDYGKVILPMTVLRRLDCVLEPTKQKLLDFLPRVESLKESAKDVALNKIAGFNFHNSSQFNFDKLIADPNNVAANYISPQINRAVKNKSYFYNCYGKEKEYYIKNQG